MIRPGNTIATGGFVGIGFAEEIAVALERLSSTLETHGDAPRDLTLVYAGGQGDGASRGLNHFAHEGLVHRVIGGHWGLVPGLQRLAVEGLIEALQPAARCYLSAVSRHRGSPAAHLSTVGLDTFVDPRNGGGKLNERTTEDLVSLISINGADCLLYKTFSSGRCHRAWHNL